MDNQKVTIPLGYKFNPKSSQLLIHFLLNKILGQSLPADVIPTFDCFSCGPDRLPLEQFKYGKGNEWYFFSRGRDGEIVMTEDGYYKVSEEKQKYKGDRIIGYVRRIEFYRGKSPDETVSEWSIKEFQLNPQLLEEQHQPLAMDSNLVVCKIIRHKSKTFENTRNTEEGKQGEENNSHNIVVEHT